MTLRRCMKLIVLLSLVLVAGCSSFLWGKSGQNTEASRSGWKPTLSNAQLKTRLQDSFDLFAMRVISAGEQINNQCPDGDVRRRALLWKSMVIPAYGAMIVQLDSRIALLDVITFTTAMRKSFEIGEGKDLFGPCQAIALKAVKASEQDALQVASDLMPPEDLASMRKEVDAWVDANKPYNVYGQSRVERQAAVVDQNKPVAKGLMAIPGTAFQMLEGIDNATQAVREMTRVGERITQIAEYSPMYGRWSMELLAFDLLKTKEISEAIGSLKTLSASTAKLIEMGENMPENMRKNLQGFLREVDARTRVMERMMEESGAMLDSAGVFMDKAQALSGMVGENADSLMEASEKWDATIAKAEVLSGQTLGVAREVSASADRMAKTLDQARKLLESAAMVDLLSKTQGLVSFVLWRLAALILFFFIVLFGYKVAVRRFARG